jgi:hypothetical protein
MISFFQGRQKLLNKNRNTIAKIKLNDSVPQIRIIAVAAENEQYKSIQT